MATPTPVTDTETFQLLLVSADGELKLWYDQGHNPGYRIYRTRPRNEIVWFRAVSRSWRKDRQDAIDQITAMAADTGTTIAPPVKAKGVAIEGKAPLGPENREHLATLGRFYGDHVETALDEEMEPKARPDRGRVVAKPQQAEAK
jgi:hypothetical protein